MGGHMKILSVDDDPIILELLTAVLASIGQTDVTTAESATEALEIINAADTPFDCFLLDIQMPLIDGIQLCKSVRMMPEYKRTPVLMITAMSDKSYIDKAFVAGATDYVTKPFDVVELTARIRTAENLVNAWQEKAEVLATNESSGRSVNTEKPFTIDEKLPIDDVDCVIDYVALENYASQLSRSKLFGSAVLAFSVVEIEPLFDQMTASEFKYLIADISEAISICLMQSQPLVAYAGNGTFVSILGSRDKVPPEVLVEELHNIIIAMDLCFSDGNPIEFSITTGEYIRLTFRAGQNVVRALRQAAKTALFKSEDMQPPRAVVPLDIFLDNIAG